MDLGLVLALMVAAAIGGAFAYHHFHAKGAVALAKLEGKIDAVGATAKADVAAVKAKADAAVQAVTGSPPVPPSA